MKNETEAGHTLHVTGSPVTHLGLITHVTVTSQRGATNFVSYTRANRTEWQVHVDRTVEPNFLRQM